MWKLLAYFCLCLHWFDPLVWLCFALFCRDVELACDETVTAVLSGEERCDYAQTLLRLSGQPPLFPLPAFSEPEPATRIKRVLSWKKPAKIVCAAVLVLAVVLGIGLLSIPIPRTRSLASDMWSTSCSMPRRSLTMASPKPSGPAITPPSRSLRTITFTEATAARIFWRAGTS